MKKIFSILSLFFCVSISLMAVPAYSGLLTRTQPDGTTINYYLHGDEYFNFYSSEDGYLIVLNENGVFEYAEFNEQNQIIPVGIKVSDISKRNNKEKKLPFYATKGSAGYDFYSPVDTIIQPNEMVMIWTDVKASMYYDNALIIIPRSSMGKHPIMISNTVGLIDSDYYGNESTDGNIGFRLFNLGNTPYEIKVGDRIGQGMFVKYGTTVDDKTIATLQGGFGSTN